MHDESQEPLKLGVRDCAAHLGVGWWVVTEAIRSKALRATKVGGRWRIRVSDLEAYKRARTNTEPSESASA